MESESVDEGEDQVRLLQDFWVRLFASCLEVYAMARHVWKDLKNV